MTSDLRTPEPTTLPEATESLRQAVYEAIGHGSMAWENIEGAGVFRDDIAREAAEALLIQVKQITDWDQPKLGLASTADLREELEVRDRLEPVIGVHGDWEPGLPMWHLVTEPWVGKESLWQHRDTPSIFSTDRGETYYNLHEPLDPEGNPRIHRIGDASA